MKFCLTSQCRTQDGSLSPRRRVAAIVPLIATLPAFIMLLTHHHDPKDTSSTGWGLVAGLAVGVLVGVGIVVIKKNIASRW